jgi:CheY-like chemotaxis protein
MLKDLGYDVITSDSGVAGLALLSKNIDLILLDIMLPDISGIDVLKLIKENEEVKNIPVIMQTGIQDSNEIDEAYKLGAVCVLLKPYNKNDLKDKIGVVLDGVKIVD